jgi:hypothetical protein
LTGFIILRKTEGTSFVFKQCPIRPPPLQQIDKHSLERMLSSTKEKFKSYSSQQKPYNEVNEVYTLLKKLQDEMNRRQMRRFSY